MRFSICVLLSLYCGIHVSFGESVQTGLDRVSSYHHLFKGKRVGIIANHTAFNGNGEFIVDVFRKMEDVSVTALFGPEHGFKGVEQDGKKIENEQSVYGIPIYSLYGKINRPTPEMLSEVDILVFDIQDIGARYYTYVSTMAYAMEAAAECGKQFIVLDRPNPINGISVQGNILNPEFSTFVGLYPIAVRHGMTVGEMAKMFRGQQWIKNSSQLDLTVIPMKHYYRSYWYDQTGLDFISPSPNMTSLDSATLYPGMCLFEGTNVSEGRGTDKPFSQFGAPWMDAQELTAELNKLALEGLAFKPVQFVPSISKYADQNCSGVQIEITDRNKLDAFWSGVKVLDTIHRLYPDKLEWKVSHFDRLCGTDSIRKAIIERRQIKELQVQSDVQLKDFLGVRQKYLIY